MFRPDPSKHAEPEIAHQRPHDGPGMRFRDFSPPATTSRSTPQPNFNLPHPVMIGLPRDRRLPRTGTGPAGAPVRGAKVGTRRHLAVLRFQRHYLLSLEERLGVHLSAIDSDYDLQET